MKKRIKQHTKTERMTLRRLKRKQGPAAKRRQARRVHLQPKPMQAVLEDSDV